MNWVNHPVKAAEFLHTRKSAVLIPIVETDEGESLLYEVRSPKLKWQPGDISFPGGGREPSDADFEETAVREAVEELGVEKSSISILGPLDYVVSPIGVTVHPFVGKLSEMPKKLSAGEVAEIFTVPLAWLLASRPEAATVEVATRPGEDFPKEIMARPYSGWWKRSSYDAWIYRYGKYNIWGLTGFITHEFLERLKNG